MIISQWNNILLQKHDQLLHLRPISGKSARNPHQWKWINTLDGLKTLFLHEYERELTADDFLVDIQSIKNIVYSKTARDDKPFTQLDPIFIEQGNVIIISQFT